MKGLSGSRSHHHGVTCDSACDSLSHHSDRKPYLLSPVDHHPADHPYYTQRNSFQAECVGPFSDPLASSTFPRRHYASQQELKDECALVPRSLATKANRIPANLLDQFERQLPLNRDGYHTLQYKRTALEHRSDSPGRIRHLVHSVQKLFTKSHSLEGPSKGSVNGGKASPDETQAVRYGKRSKSKERRAEPKARANASPGWWSSDDNLDGDMCIYHAPSGVMTMGRCPDRSASQYFMEAYNTLSEQAVKASRSNNDVQCSACANLPVGLDAPLLKKSAWSSTLTVSRAREVYQKASVNMDQAMVKSEACQQERSCQYLQVPQDEWSGYTPRGKDDEIPCRRMRSGSYIKAMGDEDSGDSDTSPKPSPKVAARRESYLKATQPSLTELTTLKISNEHSPKLQIRSHSYLRAVSEVSINRSLDGLDPAGLLTSPKFRSRNESYMRAMSTISQVSEMEVNGQFESVCESVFSELESQAVEALDLPMPGCFRMRSHSYVRAIEKGCSQDDECVSLRSSSPPRTTTTVRTIQSSTGTLPLSCPPPTVATPALPSSQGVLPSQDIWSPLDPHPGHRSPRDGGSDRLKPGKPFPALGLCKLTYLSDGSPGPCDLYPIVISSVSLCIRIMISLNKSLMSLRLTCSSPLWAPSPTRSSSELTFMFSEAPYVLIPTSTSGYHCPDVAMPAAPGTVQITGSAREGGLGEEFVQCGALRSPRDVSPTTSCATSPSGGGSGVFTGKERPALPEVAAAKTFPENRNCVRIFRICPYLLKGNR
ncbi:disks large-associated protein 1-like [Lemur catta]|uniref:disks large-associated protein 1-like n=1 Tax=Lemur catta TaxID=9447 RepID=UPI001E2670DD|nr:disks large-associated protein 1-like [Lemur catta]